MSNNNQNQTVFVASVPTQKSIFEIIKSNVEFISNVSQIIVNGMHAITISIASIKELNAQLESIYGKNGIFQKIEQINKRLNRASGLEKNIVKQRFFKLQLREILNIIRFVQKIADAAKEIDNIALAVATKTIDAANHIISVLDNIKVNPLLPIKIDIIRLSFWRFRKGIIRNAKLIAISLLRNKPEKIIFALGLLNELILPLLLKLIKQVNDINITQYFTARIKLEILNSACQDFKEMIQFVASLSKKVKSLDFKDLTIFGIAAACIQGISYTLNFVNTLDLLPTEAVKLKILNELSLPLLLHTFNNIMSFFNPKYNNKINAIYGRKKPWTYKEYWHTISGIAMMVFAFKALDAIKDTVNIFKTFISAKLGIWDKLYTGTTKMLKIFAYLMSFFNPSTKNNIYGRKKPWKFKEYWNTILGLTSMTIAFGLLKQIIKYATIAALLSVPFSICALPLLFSLSVLYLILYQLIKTTSILNIKQIVKMMLLVSVASILCFIGIQLFILALVSKKVIQNFLWILLLLGAIIVIVYMVIPLCIAGALLTFIGPFAVTGLFALTAVIGAVVLVALELRILQTIELDRIAIMNNVDAVLTTCRYIIDMLFAGKDSESFDNISKSKSWLGIIINISKGATDLIKMIAASSILFFTLVSVTLILFTLGVLVFMQRVIKDINKRDILIAVDTVMKISDFIVKAVFNNAEYDAENDRVKRTKQYENSNFITRVFRGIGDLITMLSASAMLIMTALSVGAITLIVTMLKTIQDAEFKENIIRDNVSKVIDLCKLVIDTVNAPSETKKVNDDDGIIGKALSVLLPSNLKYAIDAIMTMPFVAMTWLSISMIKGLINGLKEIENFPELKHITTNVNKIVIICKNIIDDVNQQKFDLGDIKKNNKIIRQLKKLIKNIVSISKIELNDTAKNIELIGGNINAFKTHILSEINKIDTDTLPSNKKSKELFTTVKDISKIVKQLVEFSQYDLKTLEKGIINYVGVADLFIDNTSDNKNVTRNWRYKDSLENISRYSEILRRITSLVNINASEFGSVDLTKHEKFILNNIKFLEQINKIDSSKLKRTANLYKQLRHFSESINGNFDKLVEALGEKLLPVLTELKEIMSEVPEKLDTGFRNTSASIGAANSAPTRENVAAQVSRENPNLSKSDIDAIVTSRMNEKAQADANGMAAKIDELISLLKGMSGEYIIVQTI